MAVTDSALRMALVQMLTDKEYPDNLKDKDRTLARLQETPWEEWVRDNLKTRALLWAESTDNSVGLALRRALGEDIPRDSVPINTTALASAGPPARAVRHSNRRREMQSIAEATGDTRLMTPEYERELAIVTKEFERPPYWFPGKHKRLADAAALVAAGKVHPSPDGAYEVEGSKGVRHVCRQGESCTCADSTQYGKSKWCKHLIAVDLMIEIQARIHPTLFPLPRTIDEQSVQGPSAGHQGTISETTIAKDAVAQEGLETPPRPLETPAVRMTSNEGNVSMEGRAVETRISPPLPAQLTCRSITAIIADLSRPLPTSCIATKVVKGTTISYLHWQTVARMLDTYAPGWNGEVTRLEQQGQMLRVTYRLHIPCAEGVVWREATGEDDEWEMDEETRYGNPSANAQANAFKRAAALLGCGQWLYDKPQDMTAKALAEHFKQEKGTALAELGTALKQHGMGRNCALDWLKTHTGVTKLEQIPLAAIRTMLAYVIQQEE